MESSSPVRDVQPPAVHHRKVMLTMEEAMKQSGKSLVTQGEIVKGTIIEVRKNEVMVDIGYKSEGVIPANEFIDIKEIKVGQEIDVLIEKLENKEGTVVLSHEKAEFKKNWDKILTICNEGGRIMGKVKAVVKGGLIVNVGVEAFLPSSQIDVITPKNLAGFVGNSYEFKVVKINQERQNIVLSRRELIESERNEKRGKLLGEMVPGDIRKGTVKNLTDFGAFIDLNGIDGLLHITDMSWGRLNHPSELLKVGQEIEVVVLGINREEQKISLGIRQLESNPWDIADQKYPVGTKVKGKVRNLTSYGAFVELEEGIDGMVHVSDMSWTRKINHPSETLKKGDEVEATVLEVDRANQRIALGMKQLEVDPWANIEKLYKVGDLVQGKVTKLASFGAFVGLQNEIDGLVHISQISEERVDKIKNVLKVGQDVSARVVKIDRGERRIGLSIKAASYSDEQLKEEQKILDSLKPGEDLVALQHAFDAADEARQGEGKPE